MLREFINYMKYSQGGRDFQFAVKYILCVYICYLIFNFSRNCYKMLRHKYKLSVNKNNKLKLIKKVLTNVK